MANNAIALSRIVHNGVVTEAGEELQGVDDNALGLLVAAGAAKVVTAAAPKKTISKKASSKKD